MILHTTHNVPWLPQPNTIELVTSEIIAPALLTKTAFVVPLTRRGTVVMANNRRRRLEFPGGHIEDRESAAAAAVREAFEEAGIYVSHLRAIAFQIMTSKGVMPSGYRYPFPLSFQQFFVAEVMATEPYVENDECLAPVELSVFEAIRTLGDSRAALLMQAIKRF